MTEQSKELATFVFEGTVKRIRAANLKKIPNTKRTAVVKVGTIRRAPSSLAAFGGREVTIRLAEGERQGGPRSDFPYQQLDSNALRCHSGGSGDPTTIGSGETLERSKAKSNRLLDHLVGARYRSAGIP